MLRTDIHRPSIIVPEDYKFVGFECLKIEDLGDAQFIISERIKIRNHMKQTGGTYSHHAHGGNCHICGAYAIYTALFYHTPTNVYVRTGLDCADKLDCGDVETFRRQVKTALEQNAGKRKAKALLEVNNLLPAWEIYTATDTADWRHEEEIVSDIVSKLVKYGSLSDKQFAFLRSLIEKITHRQEIDAKRAADHQAAKPVPVTDGRVMICGKVLSIKRPAPYEGGFPTRILVLHADGWKLFGSLPRDIQDVKVGQDVEFSATIKASDKDPKFGFFSRPTKARIVDA